MADLLIKVSSGGGNKDSFKSVVDQTRRILYGKEVMVEDEKNRIVRVKDALFADVAPFLALSGINAEYLTL